MEERQVTTSLTHRAPGWQIALRRAFARTHIALYRLTGGLIGHRLGRLRALLLTTTGRRSGLPRVTPITYLPDGSTFVLVASNYGSARDPLWWGNLQAHPEATVQVGRKRLRVHATQADATDRARLWPMVVK